MSIMKAYSKFLYDNDDAYQRSINGGNMESYKNAKTPDEAWKLQETFEGKPHGWIQWKGTTVCMDVHCKCGASTHIDDDFAYHVKCCKCGAVYFCNGHIEFIEVENPEDSSVVVSE